MHVRHEEYMRQAAAQLDAKEMQVGGDHYKLPIQPIDYIMDNNIPFAEANVIKYVTRHREKGGAQDIEKAIHYLELILAKEYSK